LGYRKIWQTHNSARKNERVEKVQQKINVRNNGNGKTTTGKMGNK